MNTEKRIILPGIDRATLILSKWREKVPVAGPSSEEYEAWFTEWEEIYNRIEEIEVARKKSRLKSEWDALFKEEWKLRDRLDEGHNILNDKRRLASNGPHRTSITYRATLLLQNDGPSKKYNPANAQLGREQVDEFKDLLKEAKSQFEKLGQNSTGICVEKGIGRIGGIEVRLAADGVRNSTPVQVGLSSRTFVFYRKISIASLNVLIQALENFDDEIDEMKKVVDALDEL